MGPDMQAGAGSAGGGLVPPLGAVALCRAQQRGPWAPRGAGAAPGGALGGSSGLAHPDPPGDSSSPLGHPQKVASFPSGAAVASA